MPVRGASACAGTMQGVCLWQRVFRFPERPETAGSKNAANGYSSIIESGPSAPSSRIRSSYVE